MLPFRTGGDACVSGEWSEGACNGVCARGAFVINMQWKNSRLSAVEIVSKQGIICRIDPKIPITVSSNGKKVAVKKMNDGSVEFPTIKGATYLLKPAR